LKIYIEEQEMNEWKKLVMPDGAEVEVLVSKGREHAERRAAQAAAARKRPVKRRDDYDWKKEQN
jgi:hypothetical protein